MTGCVVLALRRIGSRCQRNRDEHLWTHGSPLPQRTLWARGRLGRNDAAAAPGWTSPGGVSGGWVRQRPSTGSRPSQRARPARAARRRSNASGGRTGTSPVKTKRTSPSRCWGSSHFCRATASTRGPQVPTAPSGSAGCTRTSVGSTAPRRSRPRQRGSAATPPTASWRRCPRAAPASPPRWRGAWVTDWSPRTRWPAIYADHIGRRGRRRIGGAGRWLRARAARRLGRGRRRLRPDRKGCPGHVPDPDRVGGADRAGRGPALLLAHERRLRDVTPRPRRIISSKAWSGIGNEEVGVTAGRSDVHELISRRTPSSRQPSQRDHEWTRAFGEALVGWRLSVDVRIITRALAPGGRHVVLGVSAPHPREGRPPHLRGRPPDADNPTRAKRWCG